MTWGGVRKGNDWKLKKQNVKLNLPKPLSLLLRPVAIRLDAEDKYEVIEDIAKSAVLNVEITETEIVIRISKK